MPGPNGTADTENGRPGRRVLLVLLVLVVVVLVVLVSVASVVSVCVGGVDVCVLVCVCVCWCVCVCVLVCVCWCVCLCWCVCVLVCVGVCCCCVLVCVERRREGGGEGERPGPRHLVWRLWCPIVGPYVVVTVAVSAAGCRIPCLAGERSQARAGCCCCCCKRDCRRGLCGPNFWHRIGGILGTTQGPRKNGANAADERFLH